MPRKVIYFMDFLIFLGNKLDLPFFVGNCPFLSGFTVAASLAGQPLRLQEVNVELTVKRAKTKRQRVKSFFMIFI